MRIEAKVVVGLSIKVEKSFIVKLAILAVGRSFVASFISREFSLNLHSFK